MKHFLLGPWRSRLAVIFFVVAAFLFGTDVDTAAGIFGSLARVLPSPDSISVGPLEYSAAAIPTGLACVGALLMYYPSISKLLLRRDQNGSHPIALADASNSTDTKVNSVSATSVNVEIHQPHTHQEHGPLAGFLRAFDLGTLCAYKHVVAAHMQDLISAAKGLRLHLTDETHAVKYRQSKFIQISSFCQRIEDQAQSHWFDHTINLHGGVFTEKYNVLTKYQEKLDRVRIDLQNAIKAKRTEESFFAGLYSKAAEILDELIADLTRLNLSCQSSATLTCHEDLIAMLGESTVKSNSSQG